MRPTSRLLAFLAIPLVVACGAPGQPSSATPVRSVPASPGPSAVASTSGSASATASVVAASLAPDPVANPSISARFAVGDGPRQLALICWGEGSPTVLLETGGVNIEEWSGSGLVRRLAGPARVCTYDRAGTGASDPPPYERRDADDVVNDLKALFVAANLDGPYVLVGRSFGGMIVTHYAETLPEDVVGVVVLDTPAPDATFHGGERARACLGLPWQYGATRCRRRLRESVREGSAEGRGARACHHPGPRRSDRRESELLAAGERRVTAGRAVLQRFGGGRMCRRGGRVRQRPEMS
jgi:pimeloyl-ACP methyl ester carboxylesterase